ncbi:MAG: glycosyltransferase family 39 protein [Gammaproteobacteria bacterium]|nr:glycosyltransferase family 39 protein [Gammaproteobacteria bacterium]
MLKAGYRLREIDAGRAFALLVVVHVALWTLVPSLAYHAVPKDTLEAIAWGRLWEFGYDKHPPLAAWLAAAFSDAFGAVGWPTFLASQLAVALCFWAIWSLARSMLDPWRALAAVALLEGIHYYNVSSQIFNPNVVMLATWAMLSWTSYRAIRNPTLANWAHAGVWAGLALLTKYQSVVLFATLGAVMLSTREGRRALATRWPWLGLAVAALVVTPNLAWLADHGFGPMQHAAKQLDLEAAEPGSSAGLVKALGFLGKQAASVLPALLLALWLPLRLWGRPVFDRRNFDHVFVLALTLGPLMLTLLMAIVANTDLVSRWGFPYFSLLGVALLLFFTRPLESRQLRTLIASIAVLTVLLSSGLLWAVRAHPSPPYRSLFPYRPIAEHIESGWKQRYHTQIPYVAGARWLILGASAYSDEHPVPYVSWSPVKSPWMSEAELQAAGGVFIHHLKDPQADAELLQRLRARYPQLTQEQTVSFPYLNDAPVPAAQIWIAYLPPRAPGD